MALSKHSYSKGFPAGSSLRVLTGLGLLASIYLLWQHADFMLTGGVHGICSAVKAFDCTNVELSDFSEIAGIPTASLGVFYFFIFLGILLFARLPFLESLIALFTFAGLLVSISLAVVSALVIRAFCLGCLSVYAITLLNAALAIWIIGPFRYFALIPEGIRTGLRFLAGTPEYASGEKAARRKILLLGALGLAIANFGLVPWTITHFHNQMIIEAFDGTTPLEIREVNAEQIAAGVGVRPGEKPFLQAHPWSLARGGANAPIQIFFFTDFECPHCRDISRNLEEALVRLPADQYRLTYKLFPLNNECNPATAPGLGHPNACSLAAMAQALGKMGRFWDLRADLYKITSGPEASNTKVNASHPAVPSLSSSKLPAALNDAEFRALMEKLSQSRGVNFEEWWVRGHDIQTLREVVLDVREGLALGLQGVPALFINGRAANPFLKKDLKLLLNLAIKDKRHAEKDGEPAATGISSHSRYSVLSSVRTDFAPVMMDTGGVQFG